MDSAIDDYPLFEHMLAWNVAKFVFDYVGSEALACCVTFGAVQSLRQQPAPIGQVLATGVVSFVRVIPVVFVVGAFTGVFMMLPLLFGLWLGQGAAMLSLLFMIPGLIFMIMFFVAVPVAVLERQGLRGALRRSLELTRGNRGTIFAFLILMGLVLGLVGVLTDYAFSAMRRDRLEPAWVEITKNLLITSFRATAPAVCYFLLRRGKENVDAKQIAAVFD
jgi:hypothetical protein